MFFSLEQVQRKIEEKFFRLDNNKRKIQKYKACLKEKLPEWEILLSEVKNFLEQGSKLFKIP